MKKHIKKYWNETVRNNVIAGIILAILTSVFLFIKSLINKISFFAELDKFFSFLGNSTPIYNWILMLSLLLLVLFIFFKLWTNMKSLLFNSQPNTAKQNQLDEYASENNDSSNKKKDTTVEKIKSKEIPKSNKDLPIINEISTSFFYQKVSGAFPGVRGLEWFNNPETAIERLQILLKTPTRFGHSQNRESRSDPIWWFRGNRSMFIKSFQVLSRTKCLMNVDELKIERIAVYHSDVYYLDFVYVETKPDKTIGIYGTTEKDIIEQVKRSGYAREEFGLFKGVPITRNELDDGAAIIKGKVVEVMGKSELRVRYLCKYNFIIAAADSPYNSRKFDKISEEYLNGILRGTHTLEQLVDEANLLNKYEN